MLITPAVIKNITSKNNVIQCQLDIGIFSDTYKAQLKKDTKTSYVTGVIISLPGILPNYKVGDKVWVAFKENKVNEPIIIGKIFDSTAGIGQADIICKTINCNSLALPTTATVSYGADPKYIDTSIVANKKTDLNKIVQAINDLNTKYTALKNSYTSLQSLIAERKQKIANRPTDPESPGSDEPYDITLNEVKCARILVEMEFDLNGATCKLNAAQICGILANLEGESAFNPAAEGDIWYEAWGGDGKPTSFGLNQWHNDYGSSVGRATDMKNFVRTNYHTTWDKSIEGQMWFLGSELTNNWYYKTAVLTPLLQLADSKKNAAEAATLWLTYYGVPAAEYFDQLNTKRRASAQNKYITIRNLMANYRPQG